MKKDSRAIVRVKVPIELHTKLKVAAAKKGYFIHEIIKTSLEMWSEFDFMDGKDWELRKKLKIVWSGMIQRCTNPNTPSYKYYGGRGIKVCKSWRNNFDLFVRDMGLEYKKALFKGIDMRKNFTLDRIDNDGDYCKKNCRWTDLKTQANNRRNNL